MQTGFKIEVFSKKNCPGCDQVKQMLKTRNLVYREFLVDSEDGAVKAELLSRVPGVRTVPQVFIDNRLIGGVQDLVKELATNDYY
jgi:glutaredoxin 3